MLIPAFVLLMACQNDSTLTEVITFKPSDYDVMFIPNDTSDEADKIYMDAFIELKAKYPTEFNEAKKVNINLMNMDFIERKNGPSLLISKNGTTIAQLSGKKAKKEIIEQLEFTFREE